MFFGSRKPRRSAGGVSHPTDPPPDEMAEPESVQWRAWRCAAQKATRAWNEWLAADGRERPERYHRYVTALAEEEQAAVEVARGVSLDANARRARDRVSESERGLAG
jgi:hypothetical protein